MLDNGMEIKASVLTHAFGDRMTLRPCLWSVFYQQQNVCVCEDEMGRGEGRGETGWRDREGKNFQPLPSGLRK